MKIAMAVAGVLLACSGCSQQAQQQARQRVQITAERAGRQVKVEANAAQQWAKREAPKAKSYAKSAAAKVTPTPAQIEAAKREAKAYLKNAGK